MDTLVFFNLQKYRLGFLNRFIFSYIEGALHNLHTATYCSEDIKHIFKLLKTNSFNSV